MRTLRNAMIGTSVTAAAFAGTLGAATPAFANSPVVSASSVCGPGYAVVGSYRLTDTTPSRPHYADTWVTYNASNGKNCVVSIRRTGYTGKRWIEAGVKRLHDSKYSVDEGYYAKYAGPVYTAGSARGTCIMVLGYAVNPKSGYTYNLLSTGPVHCG
ncbi:spore-associated protein A [Actinomadura macrotermitis]|uniref:Spore-associated protein A n=1 Tax=Actinomadura macrotermitis TaxID=2585200 RepID=A0A7K0C344_9ACTN|nr:spore-associated protein A [Actinomadura macrotermitis]MQY07869.1 hypothetical protein [Actinomadura macrotermitis]